jgi:cell fate (sporulation/competence/biofilm development) regulator YlbF (YheA/YmcA/DUF963 family)
MAIKQSLMDEKVKMQEEILTVAQTGKITEVERQNQLQTTQAKIESL